MGFTSTVSGVALNSTVLLIFYILIVIVNFIESLPSSTSTKLVKLASSLGTAILSDGGRKN